MKNRSARKTKAKRQAASHGVSVDLLPDLRASADSFSWSWADDNASQSGWEAGKDAIAGALFVAWYTAKISSPVLFVTYLIVGGASYYHTGEFLPPGGITDPVLWGPFVGGVGACGLMDFILMLPGDIVAFSFDGKTQTLSYAQVRPFRKTQHRLVPFDCIISVTPTLMTSYAHSGHLSVIVVKDMECHYGSTLPSSEDDANEGESLRLGREIFEPKMEVCAAWLSTYLGARVKPTLQMDT